ncbi:MAG: ATP-dependent Clp protease proteolytic subunit [Candidatus Eisenbacteria bacterium]|uniref:ATP-dependent Clp protease proteolytic subunit n=1 Tax=Eiseniibacteriota bacterium TaxID=2212470 RepID=A0A956RPE2_UNCEI|nr:ATP-dependent Clp protease proteolytic subunit [Candidatus Eisenbacteria bacterium]
MPKLWRFDDDDDEFEDDDDDEGGEESKKSNEDPKMMERFLRARTILVSEPISSNLARSVYQQLIMLEREDAKKPITVIVNSPGGEADAGFGMYDMIRFVSCPIRTVVAGLCASAGVMVFLAGDRGQRFSLPNSRFLLHQPSSQSWGQASDLEIAAREILRLRDQYNRIVAEETGKTLKVVTEDADRDFWMSAEEAAEYGLVNRVVVSRADLD